MKYIQRFIAGLDPMLVAYFLISAVAIIIVAWAVDILEERWHDDDDKDK